MFNAWAWAVWGSSTKKPTKIPYYTLHIEEKSALLLALCFFYIHIFIFQREFHKSHAKPFDSTEY